MAEDKEKRPRINLEFADQLETDPVYPRQFVAASFCVPLTLTADAPCLSR
jgi:hypothetical protein